MHVEINVTITSDVKKTFNINQNGFNLCFENLLLPLETHIMYQPQWFWTEYDLKDGDNVLEKI